MIYTDLLIFEAFYQVPLILFADECVIIKEVDDHIEKWLYIIFPASFKKLHLVNASKQ